MPALPAGTPLALVGDWNCVAGDQDLVGGQPGTRQSGFHSGLLPLQQALGLLDAFFLMFFSFFLGGMDIHFTRATMTTSKKRDVHCKP